MILLTGIVVNNSIILIDHINSLRRKGLGAFGCGHSRRKRPNPAILMTTATTVFGLLPLVLFTKAEESIWYVLSLATIGGLSSTLLVLVGIPMGYIINKLQKTKDNFS